MRRIRTTLTLALVLGAAAGCGDSGTHAVRGKVELPGGDVAQLAQAHVEFQLEGNPAVRADGLIGPDGRFEVQSLREGRLVRGMPPGTYRARLLFGDDAPARRRPPVAPQ